VEQALNVPAPQYLIEQLPPPELDSKSATCRTAANTPNNLFDEKSPCEFYQELD